MRQQFTVQSKKESRTKGETQCYRGKTEKVDQHKNEGTKQRRILSTEKSTAQQSR